MHTVHGHVHVQKSTQADTHNYITIYLALRKLPLCFSNKYSCFQCASCDGQSIKSILNAKHILCMQQQCLTGQMFLIRTSSTSFYEDVGHLVVAWYDFKLGIRLLYSKN